jgi:hypothetical protein
MNVHIDRTLDAVGDLLVVPHVDHIALLGVPPPPELLLFAASAGGALLLPACSAPNAPSLSQPCTAS